MASGFGGSAETRKMSKNRINIFDDDVSIDAAKKIIKFSALDHDEDDDDEVNWDGTPSLKAREKKENDSPKPPMPDMSNLAVPSAPRSIINPSPSIPKSSSMYGGYASASVFGHNRSQSLTIEQKPKLEPSEGSLKDIRDTHTQKQNSTFKNSSDSISSSSLLDIDDAIGSNRKQLSAADIDKMQKEILSLRRSLLSAKRDRYVKLPIEDTLRRILKGEPYSLEMYRSLADKLTLIDLAVKSHDGNAVTAAVMFLKKTTSSQIFTKELRKRPKAADHYLHYLKEHFDFQDYIETLCLLGRTEEAGIFKFKLALPTSDVHLKISKIKDSQRTHFSANPSLTHDSTLVQEYVDLLERQRPIEDSDAKAEAAGSNLLFKDFPRKRSLVDMPVVTTLYYCCLYHYHLSENSLGSPVAIRKRHQISEKQFVWTSLGARAKLRQWKDIEAILTTKGWFGGPKLKSVIGFDNIVGILHRNNAPPDILDKYLALMDDTDRRLMLAKKVDCHKAVIDTYAQLKDRSSLESYCSKLDRYSKDGLYAYDVLNGSMVKWK